MELNGLTSVRVHASREAHCSECHLDQVRDDPIEHRDGRSHVVVFVVEAGSRVRYVLGQPLTM